MGFVTSLVLAVVLAAVTLGAQSLPPQAEPVAPANAPQAEPPKYFEVPVFGTIGLEVTPEAIELAFNEAELAGAKYVVLLFNSTGGDHVAAAAMSRTIATHPDVTAVAFVRQATNAAALIAASCPKVYIHKAGIWGVSSAADIAEMASQRVELERLAKSGGRDPLVLMAMGDLNSELHLTTVDGKPKVAATSAAGARAIKQRDAGFLLAPPDMVSCGMAEAVGATMGDVRRELGVADWTSCGTRGAEIVARLQHPSLSQKRAEAPRVIEVESQPDNQSPQDRRYTRRTADRTAEQERYLTAQASAQERAIAENKRYQERAYQERKRREEELREAEHRQYLRDLDQREFHRKQQEMKGSRRF